MKRKPFLTRSFAAGLSLIFAFKFLATAFIENFAWIFAAIWMLFFGLYDAMDIQSFEEEEEQNKKTY